MSVMSVVIILEQDISSILTLPWEPILGGLFVGILIGLTGMGGGSLVTPFLIFMLRIDPLTAVGTDIALNALTKLAGAASHAGLGNTDSRTVRILLSGSIPGALIGLLLLRFLPSFGVQNVDIAIKHGLGVVLLVAAFAGFSPSLCGRMCESKVLEDSARRDLLVRIVSFFVGAFVSVTSVGSGSLLVPMMMVAYAFPVTKVVGIDVVHGAILTSIAAAGHMIAATVDYALLSALLLGSIPGVVIGSRLSVSFPKRALQYVLGSLLAVSGIKMF